MTEPEFDYEYLPWSIKFITFSIYILNRPESITSITPFYDIFQLALVKIWSRREEMVLIMLVGS